MTDVQVEVQGAERISRMLTELGLDMKDLKDAMHQVGGQQIKYFSGTVFANRGATVNGGQRWQRLNDKYAAQKAKKYPGRPVLVRRGLMQKSFKYEAEPMSVTIYNTAPYFKYHQSSDTRHVLPRRAMIGIYSRLGSDVSRVIAEVLAKKIQRRSA